ncbi:MAG TPA: hypothetical protein DEQ30_01450, partial [Porphyromonadaceae bacterium]|nr:hypothetical protein [Porphyromonadaceae bacterium]
MKIFSCPVFVKCFLIGIVSVFLAGCASVSPTVKRTSASVQSNHTIWHAENRSDSLKNSYRVVLKTPDNSITGICILKKNGDEWRGT